MNKESVGWSLVHIKAGAQEHVHQINNPMLAPILGYKLQDYMLRINSGENCSKYVDFFTLSRLYRSGFDRCIFNTDSLNCDVIINRNTPVNTETRESII